MKTMHRYFVPILLLSISLPAFSADPHEIDRLQRQCENEKGSLLRDRRGTPSCDQLDRIFKRPMAFHPAENSTAQPKKEEIEPFTEYRWNGMYQKNCLHDKDGNASTCF